MSVTPSSRRERREWERQAAEAKVAAGASSVNADGAAAEMSVSRVTPSQPHTIAELLAAAAANTAAAAAVSGPVSSPVDSLPVAAEKPLQVEAMVVEPFEQQSLEHAQPLEQQQPFEQQPMKEPALVDPAAVPVRRVVVRAGTARAAARRAAARERFGAVVTRVGSVARAGSAGGVGLVNGARSGRRPSAASPKTRAARAVVMTLAVGLIATMALPAYAFSTASAFTPIEDSAALVTGEQTLASSSGLTAAIVGRDNYQAPSESDLAAQKAAAAKAAAAAAAAASAATLRLSSNSAVTATAYPSVVSPQVQALAGQLMDAVASGQLVGSKPDHIAEIRYLAEGQVVPGCGVDYRVLQTIKVAIDNFSKVGVSDINRLCTGQIEGAGTMSPHYRNGGGHAVDFYILNGHGLTGADSDSLKLLHLLDPLVPPNTNVGQSECRSSGSGFVNLSEFEDTCSHDHVDFISARGDSLLSD
ncbi:hypothetical protein [Subtercola vilae]|nr:hypothetical protein [Subtercola vilae]